MEDGESPQHMADINTSSPSPRLFEIHPANAQNASWVFDVASNNTYNFPLHINSSATQRNTFTYFFSFCVSQRNSPHFKGLSRLKFITLLRIKNVRPHEIYMRASSSSLGGTDVVCAFVVLVDQPQLMDWLTKAVPAETDGKKEMYLGTSRKKN